MTAFYALGIILGSRTKLLYSFAFMELKIQVRTDDQPKNFTKFCALWCAKKGEVHDKMRTP